VRVPQEYVKDGEIVLNVSFDATSALQIGNEFIEFKGRFGGVARDILVPIHRVLAIYARENGQGMAFPVTAVEAVSSKSSVSLEPNLGILASVVGTESDPRPPSGGRPALTRVK
jgi:stringent starvation protein B